jgi:hypothetical protein
LIESRREVWAMVIKVAENGVKAFIEKAEKMIFEGMVVDATRSSKVPSDLGNNSKRRKKKGIKVKKKGDS